MYLPVNIPSGVSLVVWRALWCIFGENKRPRVFPGWLFGERTIGFLGLHSGQSGASWVSMREHLRWHSEYKLGSLWGTVGFKVVYPGWLPCRHWAPALAAAAEGHTGHLSHPPPLAQRRGHRKKNTRERLKPSCTTKRDTRTYINVPMGTHKKTEL